MRSPPRTSWDELQWRFRKTEAKLFTQLADHHKHSLKCAALALSPTAHNASAGASRSSSSSSGGDGSSSGPDSPPLWVSELETKERSVSTLLNELAAVVEHMRRYTKVHALTEQQSSQFQRAQDILRSHTKDFQKSQAAGQTALNRYRLFAGCDPSR